MPATDPLPPRYANARLLGEGTFARVYAAEDTVLGCRVAVKVLREEAAADETTRRRFAREARTAAALGRHRNVVTVHDAGEWLRRPYLVLELLSGSLAERVRERVPEHVALRWLEQAAAALDFVHGEGVVHRDVKPSNLLLDELGDLRLADFGVARGGTIGEALTIAGAVVGSPGYLAPEVAAGGAATPASDRYSLAVVARELLGPRPALEPALAAVPAQRYPTAAELVAALGAAEPPTRIAPPRTRKIARIARTAVLPAAVRPRRRRAVGTGAVAAVVAVVAVVSGVGGALVADRVASAAPSHGRAKVAPPPQTCVLSPFDHDANVVVSGVAAARFCRGQAHALRLDGNRWTYRLGGELIAPDRGAASLRVVCRLRRGALSATVYDSGSRDIGTQVCAWYASGVWSRA